jgi:hypothetical protein
MSNEESRVSFRSLLVNDATQDPQKNWEVILHPLTHIQSSLAHAET